MTYINPHNGQTWDTATQPIGQLVLFVRHLAKFSIAKFVQANGDGADKRLVRAIRARFFRDKRPIVGYFRHALLKLDPPPCRCGKPGTRIMGTATFCTACGPPQAAVRGRDFHNRHREAIDQAYEIGRKQWDYRSLSDRALAGTVLHNRKVRGR